MAETSEASPSTVGPRRRLLFGRNTLIGLASLMLL